MPALSKKTNLSSKSFVTQILNLDISVFEKNLLLKNSQVLTPSLLKKISKGYPVEYAVNKTIWHGLDFFVNKNVLIPRLETEQIIEIVRDIVDLNDNYTFLDIGTGSGAIIITLKKKLISNGHLSFYGSDISSKAIKVAKINNQKHLCHTNNKINFYTGHLIHSKLRTILTRRTQNQKLIIIANLPYLSNTESTISSIAKKYEPHLALFAKNNGLDLYQKLFKQIKRYKISFYAIIIEIDAENAHKFLQICNQYFPKSKISLIKDINNRNRFITITTSK